MAIDRTPVLKRCRSLDLDPVVLGIQKESIRKNTRNTRNMSEYGVQLREKQRAKFIYGVLEKQFLGYYVKANKMDGITGNNLMSILETRLDNVVFRLGFAKTRREARQIVSHKHISVNGVTVNIPSYRVKEGDVINVRVKDADKLVFKLALLASEGRQVPGWLEVDVEKLQGSVVSFPTREQNDLEINAQLIVELYSK